MQSSFHKLIEIYTYITNDVANLSIIKNKHGWPILDT